MGVDDGDGPSDHAVLEARLKALSAFELAMLKAQRLLEAARADPAAQRAACIAAVHAVLMMMDGCEVSLRVAGPLHLLAGSLDGLNAGANPRLFRPSDRTRGRPPATDHEWVQRAIAAAAMELRRRENGARPLKDAADWVKHRTQHWDIWPTDRDANPAGSLTDWRQTLNKRPLTDMGRRAFAYCTDPANDLTAEAVLTREASVWGIPGAPAPKAG